MRIRCSCGASVRAMRWDALPWYREHRCPDRHTEEPGEHISSDALVENAAMRERHGMEARIGFTREY